METDMNTELVKQLNDMGFSINTSAKAIPGGSAGKTIEVSGRLASVLSLCEAAREGRLALKESYNKGEARSQLGANRPEEWDSWKEGSLESLEKNLAGEIDLSGHMIERAKLEKTALIQKLQTLSQDLNPRRKRRFSEHDGEWSYDRRYEIEPFQATYRAASPTRILEIEAHFSIAAFTGAREINRYGAIIWAINDLIEKAGVQTRIVGRWHTSNITDDCSRDSNIEIEVKKPGQYVAPTLIATCFSSNFFRRAIFALDVASCDADGKRASCYLGQPIQQPKAIHFSKGVLTLSPKVMGGITPEMEAEILKAVSYKG
jgi:hypothetical protein